MRHIARRLVTTLAAIACAAAHVAAHGAGPAASTGPQAPQLDPKPLAESKAETAAIQPCRAHGGDTRRPRIGLVLSGGGARGLAHVGVLKILERERIPVDCIAGTSMGAIIGGLYASGMSAAQIEAEIAKIDWDGVFTTRVERSELSLRRKEQDFEIPPLIEFGIKDGQVRAPASSVSSRGLEVLLRRYTLPVRRLRDFDRLPIPYRAVATDMETGQAVILKEGDLAVAMRSSMSVPGLFAPLEVENRLLGDGGLVNNTPVDVARAMGADVLIVSNIGTPLAGRDTLGSLVGVTAQMITILTEQNVQRSLATLSPQDVLIAPRLEGLTAGDFNRARDFIAQGEIQADAAALRLTALQLPEPAYQQWRTAHTPATDPPPTLAFVEFRGSDLTHPQGQAKNLVSRPGQVFDEKTAEADARRLAARDDYVRADYRLVQTAAGEGLVFDLEDKPWGPNYLRAGIDLYADSRGTSRFNIKLAHDRHWLDGHGSEWRNFLRLGTDSTYQTEWFRPLDWQPGWGLQPFFSPSAGLDTHDVTVWSRDGRDEVGRLNRFTARIGADLGFTWREFGELRLGLQDEIWRDAPEVVTAQWMGPTERATRRETSARLRLVLDQLDYAWFPRRGWRVEGQLSHVLRASGFRDPATGQDMRADDFQRYELLGQSVYSYGPHTLSLLGRAVVSDRSIASGEGRYGLGGFQQMSGFARDQLRGDNLVFLRANYYVRLATAVLSRGLWAGATLEAGNTWDRRRDVSLDKLRHSMSLYLGADTPVGPLFLGTVYSPDTGGGLILYLGRP